MSPLSPHISRKTCGSYFHWIVDKQESAKLPCVFLGSGGCYLEVLGFTASSKSPTHLKIAMIDVDLGYLEVTAAGPLLPETTSQVPFSVLLLPPPPHSFSDSGGLVQKQKIKLAGNQGSRSLFIRGEQVSLERPLESVSASHPPPFHTQTPAHPFYPQNCPGTFVPRRLKEQRQGRNPGRSLTQPTSKQSSWKRK